ncbi:MAG: rod-binding protein [Pirellulales bacterium]
MIEPASTGPTRSAALRSKASGATDGELRTSFDAFVGEVFFGQMLKSMRKTVGKPAYFHGGRGEEVFQSQLDQVLAQKMTEASADQFTGPMFELFHLKRS